MPDFQLLNVLNGNLSFATRKTTELEMFFSLGSRACGVCGGGRVLPFSPCVLLLWIHQGFPSKALVWNQEMVPDFVTETKVTPQEVKPWSTCVTLRQAGAAPQGLGLVFTCEASGGEKIHIVLLTHCPCNLLPPTGSQQGRAGGSSAAPLCYATKADSITCCVGS